MTGPWAGTVEVVVVQRVYNVVQEVLCGPKHGSDLVSQVVTHP